jgi:hypothetical protein
MLSCTAITRVIAVLVFHDAVPRLDDTDPARPFEEASASTISSAA